MSIFRNSIRIQTGKYQNSIKQCSGVIFKQSGSWFEMQGAPGRHDRGGVLTWIATCLSVI